MLDYDARLNSPQSLRAGTSLIIDVNFTATPSATVAWYFNDAPLAPTRATVSGDISHTNLHVKAVGKDDAGVYKVKVTNKAGSTSATFTVGVKGEGGRPGIRPVYCCFNYDGP